MFHYVESLFVVDPDLTYYLMEPKVEITDFGVSKGTEIGSVVPFTLTKKYTYKYHIILMEVH